MTGPETIQLVQEVTVKVVVTDTFRQQLQAEIESNLQQLSENQKKLQEILQGDAGGDPGQLERVKGELQKLDHCAEELRWRVKEAQSLKNGAELFLHTVQALMPVSVGQPYQRGGNQEIIVKDGIVVELRNSAN